MMTILFHEDFEGDDWYDVPVGSGIMKNGWVPWFTEQKQKEDENGDPFPWENLIPEPGHPDENDPHLDVLVHSGVKCLQVSLRYATHWAGAYRVYTAPGLTGNLLTFSCYGHTRYHGSGSENPDHPGEIGMKVGIDPTGGIDALADSVVWGPEHPEAIAKGFDEEVWVLFTVTAVAQNDSVTVFLHSNPEWAVEFVGPNWDDATLTMAEPLPEECWGQPRIQYKRIYNVVSTMEEAHRVLDLTATRDDNGILRPQTTGVSSDDAGMGMVENKTAVEWNRPQDVQKNYREFYATHYPRAKVQFRGFDAEEPELALWSQRDPRWRDYVYGGGATLGVFGCLITCIAMLTGDEPPACARKLADAGVLEGSYVSRPAKIIEAYPDLSYGGTVHWRNTAADLDALAAWLEDGPVVIETEFSPGGAVPPTDQHFVIALELDGDDLIIADPWTGEIARLLARYALANWDLRRAIYGARLFGHTPQGPQEPLEPIYRNLLGLQIQNPSTDAVDYYARTQGSAYLTIQHFQTVAAIKLVSPKTNTVIRRFPNNFLGKGPVEALVAGIAGDLRTLHQYIDFVQLLNEQIPSAAPDAIRLANDTEIWGMEALKALGYDDVGVIIHCAGVGNPYGPWDAENGKWDEQPLLVKAALAAEDMFPGRWAIGYHAYWPSNLNATYLTYADVNGVRSYVGRYYSFRWMEWDKEFRKHGLRPRYLFTEMGPIGTHGPRPTDGYIDCMPDDGWKSSNCLGNNRTRLMNECGQWQAECAAYNATHDNCVLGGTFFITNPNSDWKTFAFEKPEMDAWATRLES